jgi:hypothetical protein
MIDEEDTMTATPPPKKPYRPPVVRVYGDIRAITRAVGLTGLADGGALKNMMMTRP